MLYQLFVGGLCALLDLPAPEPANGQPELDGYVYARRVIFRHGDGSESAGFIDLYRRGAFVLEAKKPKPGVRIKGFDTTLLSVGLLPARAFSDLLDSLIQAPEQCAPMVGEPWRVMRLEGEALNQLEERGDSQDFLELAGVAVDPRQPLGLEVKPRACSAAFER